MKQKISSLAVVLVLVLSALWAMFGARHGAVLAAGNEIWVAAGVYKPTNDVLALNATFALKEGVAADDSFTASDVIKLIAADGAAGDEFGGDVAVDGDLIVVGAFYHSTPMIEQGAVYIFGRNQGGADNWGLVKKLTADDADVGDYFGSSVAIDGDTIVAGAFGDDLNRGAAYVFERNQGGANNWGQVKKLVADDGVMSSEFGTVVAIHNSTIVVGSYGYDGEDGIDNRGAAYVFERNQGGANNWGQVKKLVASDSAPYQRFGWSVSVNGDTSVVSALFEGGAVYVFARNQGGANNWGEVTKLTTHNFERGTSFGWSVAVDGDTVVVGQPFARVLVNPEVAVPLQGMVHVFERNQGGAEKWGHVASLVDSSGVQGDLFGYAVDIDGDKIVAGAYGNEAREATYLFGRSQDNAGDWQQLKRFTADDEVATDEFGWSVAVDGDTLVVGAYHDDVGDHANQGSAYVFTDLPNEPSSDTSTLYLPAVLR